MELKTKRLKLLPCTKETLAAFSECDYAFGPHITSYIEELTIHPELLGWGVWLVIDSSSGKVIGDMGFKGHPDKTGTVEIGYGIISSKQNKGYATEGVQRLLRWAFDSEEVECVTAECHMDNAPSIRLLHKIGMEVVDHKGDMIYWQMRKNGTTSSSQSRI